MLVDDSHGFGVLGKYGRGVYEHYGLTSEHINRTTLDTFAMSLDEPVSDDAVVDGNESENFNLPLMTGHWPLATSHSAFNAEQDIMNRLPVRYYHSTALTTAIGGSGGIIAGSELFIERLMERSTAFGNMAAPCSPLAAGTAAGMTLTFLASDCASGINELRQKLRDNTHYLKKKLSGMGIATDSSDVPIIAVTLGTSGTMRRIQQRLSERGVLIAYIPRSPGLPNDGTLRIAIFATHTVEMLDHLADQLSHVI